MSEIKMDGSDPTLAQPVTSDPIPAEAVSVDVVNEIVPSDLPKDENGLPLFYLRIAKKHDPSKAIVLEVNLRVVRPVTPMVQTRNQTWIFINGTPGSGKTTLGEKLQQVVDDLSKNKKLAFPPVVIVDTDMLLAELWKQVRVTNQEDGASYFLFQVHTLLQQFFDRQPENTLVICCGVTDFVTKEDVPNGRPRIGYMVPHLPEESPKYFLKVDTAQIIRQKFNRDVVREVSLIKSGQKYLDPYENLNVSWSPRDVFVEAATDYQVYVKTLGFETRT